MDTVETMQTWRSIRAYRPDPISRSEIADLLLQAVQVSTPPGNDTPWAFCVLEGQDRIEACGNRAMDYIRRHRPQGQPGWNWVDKPGFKIFWGAPAVVLICARSGNAEAPFDCCRAGQNLALAAHARGLGSCWVGAPMLWLRGPGAADLGVPSGFDPCVVMLLGHPQTRLAPKPRPVPDIVWCSDSQVPARGWPEG
jgi:nitroreductase